VATSFRIEGRWQAAATNERVTAAPLSLKDKIIVGATGGDSGVRDYVAALDAATGKQVHDPPTGRQRDRINELWTMLAGPKGRLVRRDPQGAAV
jgi:hypothetical protein